MLVISFHTSVPLHVLFPLLGIPLLYFIYLLPTYPLKLNSCHFFPQQPLRIAITFKPVFAEHLLRAKHWVKHVSSVNSLNPWDNLRL